jgi:L-asparaginase II
VCAPSGDLLDSTGDPRGYVYLRSCAKPFQALPLVFTGAADGLGLTPEELAVACASHNAEKSHLAAVRSILQRAGLSEEDLQSGAHTPLYEPAAAELARRGCRPRAIHGNCSGKHAGMLAVCVHEGWPTATYRSSDHPLQRLVAESVSRICSLEQDELLVGTDGCGVPAFAMPLANLATGFARLATGEGLSDELAAAAGRVWRAMRDHPHLVAGTGRFDTAVMRGTRLAAKSGAEGVFAAGSPDGWGLALKISDGASRAVRPAAREALARRGVLAPREDSGVLDLHGELAGALVPLS